MYKLFVSIESKMLPIANEKEIIIYDEDKLETLQELQKKSYDIGRPMWIIYLNNKKDVS